MFKKNTHTHGRVNTGSDRLSVLVAAAVVANFPYSVP
jgi:hypothetical protein